MFHRLFSNFVRRSLLSIVLVLACSISFSFQQPNVILIFAEDLGPQLSCYGEKQLSTPNLDQFAKEGRRYTNAFCAAPICSPSRSSIMLGAHPQRFGALDHRLRDGNGKSKVNPLPTGIFTLSQHLKAAGYYTALGCGFHDKTDLNFDSESALFDGNDWNKRKPGQPFFAQITLGSTHPGSDWEKLLLGSPKIDPAMVKLPPVLLDIPESRKWYANYLSIIQYMDKQFKKIMDRIDSEGLRENSLVIFCGDNGSSILRGKEWLYDAGLHVPLIVRWPSSIRKGDVNSGLISMLDVSAGIAKVGTGSVPTQMDGIAAFDKGFRGREFVAGSRGRSDEKTDAIRCVRTKRYKYIRNFMPEVGYQLSYYAFKVHPHLRPMFEVSTSGRLNFAQSLLFAKTKPVEELYDIRTDPWELKNLAGEASHRKDLDDGRRKLASWLNQIKDPLVDSLAMGR